MTFLEERDLSTVPTIPEFYRGKTIFITGGSGFMGKVLVEKLLYSCSELDRIYLLMRPKKGVASEDRLKKMYDSPCFLRLKKEKPDVFKSKVFVMAGDVSEIGLGLCEEDRALLVNRVNIIYHVAASVRFDDYLPMAAKMNIIGTREVINLAKEVRNLSVLIHVSTTYSNTLKMDVFEKMYPALVDWREFLEVCDNVDENTLCALTPKYLGKMPNSYVFTKQLAEHVVYEERGNLPIVIIRPSIVVASCEEPFPGWVENFNGPIGIMVASGKGVLRSVYVPDPSVTSDYVPVDFAIKLFIAASWIRGTKPLEPTDDIAIYHSCANDLYKVSMQELNTYGTVAVDMCPFNPALFTTGGNIVTSKVVHYIRVFLTQLLPAILIDTILWILGKDRFLMKIQRKIRINELALSYYATKQWNFENANLRRLRAILKEQDKQQFYYELETINREDYFRLCTLTARRYLLKEKDEDMPMARTWHQRFKVIDKVMKILFYGSLSWWIVHTTYFRDIIQSIPEHFSFV